MLISILDYIFLVACMSLYIWGVKKVFDDLLFWISEPIYSVLKTLFGETSADYIVKPLFTCIWCMASVWGIIFFWVNPFETLFSTMEIIWALLATCGLNYIVSRLLDR